MTFKSAVLLASVLGAGGLAAGSVSAMPIANGLDAAVATGADLQPQIEQARWVCGPFRCHWAPNYWRPAPRFYRPAPRFYRPWGWGWRRWR